MRVAELFEKFGADTENNENNQDRETPEMDSGIVLGPQEMKPAAGSCFPTPPLEPLLLLALGRSRLQRRQHPCVGVNRPGRSGQRCRHHLESSRAAGGRAGGRRGAHIWTTTLLSRGSSERQVHVTADTDLCPVHTATAEALLTPNCIYCGPASFGSYPFYRLAHQPPGGRKPQGREPSNLAPRLAQSVSSEGVKKPRQRMVTVLDTRPPGIFLPSPSSLLGSELSRQ
ncbi:hypothetical protein H920_07270 [Fukomys damarensis]|uniref:Uncharacterized protein n=1 Tax=Fukomys damarensis TaxID=885580 RepID=A0A091DM42_FUKDA|nr:hypothetical protein H920_07270 [Fukomys damarensis]